MRALVVLLVTACALVLLPNVAESQETKNPEKKAEPEKKDQPELKVEIRREVREGADRPTAPLRVRVYREGDPEPPPRSPLPSEPPPPPPPPLEPPPEVAEPEKELGDAEFFGEPVTEDFVFVIDRSGSMDAKVQDDCHLEDADGNVYPTAPSRMTLVIQEAVKCIRKLEKDNDFAIVSFGRKPTPIYFKDLVEATEANKLAAEAHLKELTATGGTPALDALIAAAKQYGDELEKFFFLCDGVFSLSEIDQFLELWKPMKEAGCQFVFIFVGDSQKGLQNAQSLVRMTGGKLLWVK